jgi:hypothetical protein
VSRVRRRPVVDAYVEDGRAAVFALDGDVVALSELATWAWSALTEDWTEVAVLSEALVAEFGEPEGVEALVATDGVVEILVGHGLAERS